jgi:acetylornithine deacetylase/succinyl-diaminopimelate desuccinylase-like protein
MGSIGFLITGHEEAPAINGTEKLLRWAYEKGERFDHCLVGEPTSADVLGDTIKNWPARLAQWHAHCRVMLHGQPLERPQRASWHRLASDS